MKKLITSVVAIAAIVLLSASSCDSEAADKDKQVTNDALVQLQNAQPQPVFKWSQERETLIQLLAARATTTPTTSIFYNQGIKEPITSCPSIGFPIASTTQLTSPDQWIGSGGAVVALAEPVGVYTGNSTGTYVLCITSKGVQYPFYWEGFVATIGGQAEIGADGQVRLIGEPTVVVKSQ